MEEEVSRIIKKIMICFGLVVFFLFLGAWLNSFLSGERLDKAFMFAVFRILGGDTTLPPLDEIGESIALPLIFTFLAAYVLYYLIDNVVWFFIKINMIGGVYTMTKLKKLKNHVIICGGGRVGYHAADKLAQAKEKFLIIENDVKTADGLKRKHGFFVLNEDCLDENTLKKAGIEKAKAIICALGTNEDNLFLVVQAKHLNPNIKIATRCDNTTVGDRMKALGADIIITPEVIGGYELANKVLDEIE